MLGSHVGIDQFMEMVDCSNMSSNYLFMDRGYTIRVKFTITHSLIKTSFLKSTVPGARQAIAYSPISNFFLGSTVPGRE